MITQVVVLGMHRSGTSMVAEMLQTLGVFMGKRLVPADGSNVRGHFEDMEFSSINRSILRDAGGDWRKVPPQDAIDLVHGYGNQIRWLIARRNRDHEVWGFKDPRTLLTLSHWDRYLDDPLYVLVERDKRAIAKSLQRRNGMLEKEALALHTRYVSRMLPIMNCRRFVTVNYAGALKYPTQYTEHLARALGVGDPCRAARVPDRSLDHSKEE